jgi:transposase-like protein
MEKRSRRKFTAEFKAETVALIRRSGKSITLVPTCVPAARGWRNWRKHEGSL